MHRNLTLVSPKQERIAALAKQSPQMAFTSLAYLMDLDWLKEAYRRTRKDGAVGVDGVSAEDYERDLEATGSDRSICGVRHLRSPASAACAYSERRLEYRDTPARNSSTGDKLLPACGRHVAGADLRTRLSGVLVLIPAWAMASGVGGFPEPVDELSGRLCT